MQLTSRFPFRFHPAPGLLLLVLVTILCAASGEAWAIKQNTVFVPFKINAANQQKIAKQADAALQQELQTRHFTMLSREKAAKLVDYAGPWPPPAAVLMQIAQKIGFDYVAVGSLTLIGGRMSLDVQVFDTLAAGPPHSSYRDNLTLSQLQTAVHETVTDILGYTNRNFIIASIAPAGNKRIDSGAIMRKITTRPGDIYDPAQLRKDLKAVFSMGYFDDVQIESTDTNKGKAIIFRVKEKPVISKVLIEGTDEIKEQDVRDAANISANSILNPARLNGAVERIKELYKSKGYYKTTVTAKLSYPAKDKVAVRFVVHEGKKVYIGKISFKGNKTFDAGDLRDVIKTSTRGWFSWITDSGILKMDVLNHDTERLGAFYHNHGFIEAKIGDPIVKQQGGRIHIIFPIQEGPRYRVGTVDIKGDLIESKDKLISLLKIRHEKFLNRKILRDDILRLTDLYAEHGYAFAEVRPQINSAPTGKRVDIVLTVKKGALVHFNRIEIEGNTRTRDNVIRRELVVKEGGIFDSKAIRKSTANLQRLNFFEDVSVTPKPTVNPDQMNVLVKVKEKSTGKFSVGAGYSSSDSLMFMTEISENNLMGTGNRLSLAANLSSISTRFNLSYTDPRVFDSEVLAGIDLYNWRRVYDDYTKDSRGGALRFGQPFFEKWRLFYSYSYATTTLADVANNASWIIKQSEDIKVTSAIQIGLARDTRNRYYGASTGSKNTLSIKYAGGPLSGDAQFTKVEVTSSWYFPLPLDCVFHVKGAAGQAFANETDKLPVYEHFYLGGLGSIRGFKSAHISPKDPVTGERIGGDKMWYGNIEVIFPLVKNAGLRGVVFTDFGNVYAVGHRWDFASVKKSVGIGFRWLSPMGPLRLAWGYNLDPTADEDSSVWDFSIGGGF